MMRALATCACACAAAAFCGAAAADETFEFTFAGSGFHLYNAYECPGTICTTPGYSFGWGGTVTVETNSSADGLYTVGDLLSVSMNSTRGGFIWHAGGPFRSTLGSTSSFGAPSVTISDGEITSLHAPVAFPQDFTSYNFDGLAATYSFGGCHHCGLENASAVLIAVPEPGTWALMLAGLGALGLTARRRPHQRSG